MTPRLHHLPAAVFLPPAAVAYAAASAGAFWAARLSAALRRGAPTDRPDAAPVDVKPDSPAAADMDTGPDADAFVARTVNAMAPDGDAPAPVAPATAMGSTKTAEIAPDATTATAMPALSVKTGTPS